MTTLISARCHCGRNKFKIPFTSSSLPRPSLMCHCDTCRHSTGSIGLLNLTVYHASANIGRYFCTMCSAHMFFRWNALGEDRWGIMTGCLEQIDGIVTLKQHEFVGDTLDGGLADHLPCAGVLPSGWRAEGGVKDPELLPLRCHCKHVHLILTRPMKKVKENDIWVVPGEEASDSIRFMASHCLCNDCRLASGQEITTWLIVSDENVIDAATNAPVNLQDPEKRPKSLKQYVSSEGHHRESCKTCGATVFWWRHMEGGETPHMDVAAGLIDEEAAGGVRAESWFAWDVREPGFAEYALSKETARALKDGWKAHVAAKSQTRIPGSLE
ncbi:hypothetical protein FA13DRAFT_1762283 [Coprinellus micaceus]|uniref:CENP-V/GFA domain-containing protein n=1 Tax=Coprinellus micaceus TaxID=71717 RepID=A0A4Y7TPH6_COPMI|nr:hypothetical protein FA13DRAFT_1762283 [Coprinellus micaceus]